MYEDILSIPLRELYSVCPYLKDFFLSLSLTPPPADSERSVSDYFASLEYFTLDEVGVDRDELPEKLQLFMENMDERMKSSVSDVRSLTITDGRDKDGNPEISGVTLNRGELVSLVGPTGSGKSRLLSDIEWLSQGDSPSGRKILVNGGIPDDSRRFSPEKKIVAQLSQNMNFVMDVSAADFIRFHCESRLIFDTEEKIKETLEAANALAGEPIFPNMPVTSLSGGQSRALMIADTACLSSAPIILIDEIENAGINRQEAVKFLINADKIVLMATHDPVLALRAARRIVIKNGGISEVLETGEKEKAVLSELEEMNNRLMSCRERLRNGLRIA